MKREYLPFYISRGVLGIAFALLTMGFTWKAIVFAVVFVGGCLLYLHSGWFSVDLSNPLFPLHRDHHGQEVQRKALITSIIVGSLIYVTSPYLSGLIGLSLPGKVALLSGILTYFFAQVVLFVRA